MLYAKVKPESQYRQIGHPDFGFFSKEEWRPVMLGAEEDVKADPDLITTVQLEARVRQDHDQDTAWVWSFFGNEYAKDEWRPIPIECTEETRTHRLLEVRESQ